MRRLLAILLAAVVAVLLAGPAQARTTLGPQASAFRTDAIGRLHAYEAQVGPELTRAERARVHALVTDADRRLASLAVASARLDRARPAQKATRKAVAVRAFTAARSSADAALAEIQPLAVRTLGFGELLQAKGEADALLARFDRLGAAIQAA